jgi:hypothetical protein
VNGQVDRLIPRLMKLVFCWMGAYENIFYEWN